MRNQPVSADAYYDPKSREIRISASAWERWSESMRECVIAHEYGHDLDQNGLNDGSILFEHAENRADLFAIANCPELTKEEALALFPEPVFPPISYHASMEDRRDLYMKAHDHDHVFLGLNAESVLLEYSDVIRRRKAAEALAESQENTGL